jgi:hypothetical protein
MATWIPIIPQLRKYIIFMWLYKPWIQFFMLTLQRHQPWSWLSNVSYLIFYKNKNIPYINRCAQIYKFIEIFIYFNS